MRYKAVIFDFDGTLTDSKEYSWQTIHRCLKIDPDIIKKAHKDFAEKRFSYQDWVDHDIELWKSKDANKEMLLGCIKDIHLMPNAIETLTELKNRGIKIICLVSGSVDFLLEKLIPNYKDFFDHVFINKIVFDEKGDIIEGVGTPFDMETKVDGVKHICKEENILTDDVIFVGDSKNDLGIIGNVGLFIAIAPKDDELKAKADVVIENKNLKEILKFI